MRIGERTIDSDAPPYVIAEIGVNHDGRAERALELVDAAADAGADAVKFQLFRADLLLSDASELAGYQRDQGAASPFDLLRALELPLPDLSHAAERAHARGLHALVTVFSTGLIDAAMEAPWDAFKVASPDIVNRPLIRTLLAQGLPLILSTGASTLEEVRRATDWCQGARVALLQCVSSYPTPDERAALGGIGHLHRTTGLPVGYSDHTAALDTGGLAVAAGAVILEKHLTHDRSAPGPDHAASLDPVGFAEYVRLARRAWTMVGPHEKRLLDEELDVRRVSRQSIVAARVLSAGTVLVAADVAVKRPGTGIEPWRLNDVLGRTVRHEVRAGMPLREEDLA
ncbi:MAG: N-acetylneuraminate synthase family protein [Phycisphaerales bacterium]|nr:N-acetylneuraminate synthase family protein [Phycisphaerales bacterium]